ncbi:hypothetical protein J7G27_000056 [Vibrio vulnificus]|uniref:hypothetical protein n=1 Tax=Vibrio vulnificus TaxID=672 RepID=UPI0015949D79|nr:hypothetical protein [Vibrio vulnificus]EGQ8086539.1 hypothetical protein [Vibrio vulnificus]EHD0094742.1 hypothetical protein [Vibrio vulnificus]EHH1223834.1 hypothetical protein [Vibrio vulnificus]EHV9036769.1 hypothetical protein [Vibrio vulnificus]EIZ1049719.1 hypothetical protein [Vibrio vulnificus]
MKKYSDEVFGVSNTILEYSYVDRGNLDVEISRHLRRKNHVALRGASKSGKSWLRQRCIPDSLVVQCRFKTTVLDIYTDALSQLGIKLIVEETQKDAIKGKIEATADGGIALIAKIKLKMGLETNKEDSIKGKAVGHDINDLRFISDLIKESGKRLVIEDFHYLSIEERLKFSYDLKALWDYGCFIVLVGVWTRSNLLIALNRDLADRIVELSVDWTELELKQVINKGASVLKVEFNDSVLNLLTKSCYKNVGLLQKLVLAYLDELNIDTEQDSLLHLNNTEAFESAAMSHAEQLDTTYQQFARDVSSGIRKRKDSTGIYAHAMAAIVAAEDRLLIEGFTLDEILRIAAARQPRIIKTNLRTVLQKLEELQVDSDGRGLVIAFNDANDEVTIIDRRFLFYRKYVTINWPWEELIKEHDNAIESKSIIVTK